MSGPSPAPLQATDPRRLGRYQIVGRLGQGGMGTVYFGRAPDGTPVAIKVIKPELAERPEFRARFRREAESAQRVRRFTTAAVLDADPDGLYPYLVTEYVEGPTLSKMVARRGPLRPADLEQLALSVATALSAIHAAGIVHRDLTPANVLLSPVGPKVIDFGLARDFEGSGDMSRTRAAIGTPGYMAPEQIIDAPVTSAADVFAWGAITIFAATGRPPFGEGRMEALLYRILHEPANAEGVPPELVPLVDAAMRKEPERRPTAEQLRVALMSGGALPADVPPAAGPATPGTESQPRRRGLFGRGGQRRQSSEPPVSGIRPVPATTGTLSPPPGTSPVPAASGPVSPAAGPVPAPGPTYSPPPAGYPPTAAPVNPAAAATWSPATQTPRSPAPAQPTPPPVPQSPVPQSPVPRSPTPTPWPQPA
ncbi:MAG: protein kinase, partial [Frankia sp.]|nr:protein kinase [Frankia sp.]